jgi:hypothetical protein
LLAGSFREYRNACNNCRKDEQHAWIRRTSVKRQRKPKIGRPPLGAAARKQIVTLKLTKVEHTAVRAAVRRSGPPTTVSSWFRDHGLAPLGMGGLTRKRRGRRVR